MSIPIRRSDASMPRRAAAVVLCAIAACASVAAAGLAWTSYLAPADGASLAGVDARTSRDVWAVGLQLGGPCQYRTLSEHFDGKAWRVVDSPNVPGRNTVFADVAALAADDAWAVGASGCADLRSATVAAHWDGTRWRLVPTPSPGTFDVLAAVAAIARDDVWALGSTLRGGVAGTLAEHWDGAAWSVVPTPAVTAADELAAASASSSHDVWAVGSGPAGEADAPIALHWDGSSWQSMPVPTPGGNPGFLAGVFARAPGDAWAVGGYRPGGGVVRPLALHWDGTRWHAIPIEVPGKFVVLEAVDGTPGGGTWAAGYTVDAISSRAIVLRHAGGKWIVEDPPPTADVFDLSVVRGGLWGVSGAQVVHGVPGR
jgi:hypothetical protein